MSRVVGIRDQERFRGCMLGGAIGDALGYAVEFDELAEIRRKYGKDGIQQFELTKGKALVSDDTQMSLFTAVGLIMATWRAKEAGINPSYLSYINSCYKDWYRTQTETYPLDGTKFSWLANVSRLFDDRDPGMTCLASMRKGGMGTIENPLNDSKGCGGIMRVAPIGLYFIGRARDLEEIDMLAAGAAALTHGHQMGYIPAAALVHIIQLVGGEEYPDLEDAVEDMKRAMKRLFGDRDELPYFIELIDRAVQLSGEDMDDTEALKLIGEGWVAEETLAIAIYCALKYKDDFRKAVITSVNHSGDSDSTGAITGNIMGAMVGTWGIPPEFKEDVELADVIMEVTDDLFKDKYMSGREFIDEDEEEEWYEKYMR